MTGPFLIGVDPSSMKIAVVGTMPVLHTQLADTYSLKRKGALKAEHLAKAEGHMDTFLTSIEHLATGPRFAWVETPLVGRGGVRSTIAQAQVRGIVAGRLSRAGFVVYDVNVSTWKAAICGNWHAEKPDVLRTVKTLWPKVEHLIGQDGDLADAAAICLYGQRVVQKAAAIRAS